MGIKFQCPNGHKLNVKSFLAGKKGICPHCGAKFRIPTSTEPVSAGGVSGAVSEGASGTTAATGPRRSESISTPQAPVSWHTPADDRLPAAKQPHRSMDAGADMPQVPMDLEPLDLEPVNGLARSELGEAGRETAQRAPDPREGVKATAGQPPVEPVGQGMTSLTPTSSPTSTPTATPTPATFPVTSPTPAPTPTTDPLGNQGPHVPAAEPPAALRMPDPLAEAPDALWYVRPPSGGQYGPASGECLEKWIAEGRVSADSLVWREGWPDWRLAGALFLSLANPAFVAPGSSASASFLGGKAVSEVGPAIHVSPSTMGTPKSPVSEAAVSSIDSGAKKPIRRRRSNGLAIAAVAILALLSVILLIVFILVATGSFSS